MWHFTDHGSGRPLVLLHGIGMSHAAWDAVTPHLRSTRRVIAFDIAGFGRTPPLPAGTAPTVTNLVDELARSIRELGVAIPVDIAGNSLGGGMALAAASRRLARSAVAISPIGLWQEHPPRHVKPVFAGLRFAVRTFPEVVKAAVRLPWLRELALAVPISVGSRRMPGSDAVRAVDDLGIATAFEETFESTRAPFSGGDTAVPVTVAFGDRDWILTKGARRRNALPSLTTWVTTAGWGHVPMWVDPIGVARLILEGISRAEDAGTLSGTRLGPNSVPTRR
jgi:pimeloyl-ACP methyl ester carboxylesterase